MSELHIKLSSEVDNKLRKYCNTNKFNFSEGISNLIEIGLDNIDCRKQIDFTISMLSKIYSKNAYIVDLIEKLYSDLEIDNNTNPKDNKCLQDFKISKLRDNFYE